MTREEAIQALNEIFDDSEFSRYEAWYGGAMDMAIEALQADAEERHYIKIYADDEPSVKAEKLYQICGETQHKEVTEWLKEYFPDMAIEALQTDAVHGEWEHWGSPFSDESEVIDTIVCSVCGARFIEPKGEYHYCPNCGAKMGKGGDDE